VGDAVVALPPWAHVSDKRRGHIERVGRLVDAWATDREIAADERERWLRAVALHDALKDAPPDQLRALAPDAWGRDSLRHGPAAAAVARREGETDRGVLDAVHYHSVGYAGWDDVGRMLYLADFLEPGRRRLARDRDRLTGRVPADPDAVLREVARQRLELTIAKGYPLLPETVAFWNALT
jgi:HD superfamily phosphohydrolase YqeK